MSLRTIASHLVLLILATSLLILSCGERAQKTELDKSLVGTQAICPVTGDEFTIHDRTPVVKYREGLYYMCCPGCDTEFMKDPEKYIVNMGQKERSMGGETHGEQKIQYWTCAMHPEVKSDEAGNCPICGMDLIPVYERSESDNTLNLSDREIELAGIRMVPATRKHLYREIHVVGMVAHDPDLVIAQEEYVNALEMSEMMDADDEPVQARAEQLVKSSEYKLRLLGMDMAEIAILKRTRRSEKSLILPEARTWIYADVYEPDLGWITRGQQVFVTSRAIPGLELAGRIQSVGPVLDKVTRAASVRIQMTSAEPVLTPGMYVEARIIAPSIISGTQGKGMMLAVPKDAVLDTGNRKIVWVYLGEGQFQPRLVRLGAQASVHGEDDGARFYPVFEGLTEHEMVVTKGNFLIDSESSLTGIAAIGYGGALGVEDRDRAPTVHQH
jgi:Cu(I)/Ag(I) efflux system membrane fusion protein